ncbi:MAG: glycosyltransferase family 39 protein [Acetobacteraceae bacterium]
MRFGKQLGVLVLAAMILLAAATARGFEYDEAYSVFVTSPTPRPSWPTTVFRAGEVRGAFTAHAGPLAIARALRETDVHPPLYFWTLAAWRRIAGDGLLAMRSLSILCALIALLAVGAIARTVRIPAALAMLLTVGCYGFAYTGAVARGFALAQALDLCGVLVLLRAERAGGALLGGMALGAATFTNYLSAFTGLAALAWLLASRMRRPSLWLSAGFGFAAFLPADLWFFLAQRASRAGQFPPFRLAPSLARLAKYGTASLFGGLPMYVGGSARVVVGALVGGLAVGLAGLLVWRWRAVGSEARWLLLACAAATPLGLLALGAAFGNTPIELRYLCFATPFAALLLAGALAAGRGRRIAGGGVVAVQAMAIAGLILRPETMQPAREAARTAASLAGADAVVVLPRGNDGVGVVGPFLAELPNRTRVLLVGANEDPSALRARLPPGPVVLALLGQDADSLAASDTIRAAFPAGCWQPTARGCATIRLGPGAATSDARPPHRGGG